MRKSITFKEIIDLYNELDNRECGDSYITNWEGKRISTDTGYAFEGIELFIEEIKHKLERS